VKGKAGGNQAKDPISKVKEVQSFLCSSNYNLHTPPCGIYGLHLGCETADDFHIPLLGEDLFLRVNSLANYK